jgi:hypothetical protein
MLIQSSLTFDSLINRSLFYNSIFNELRDNTEFNQLTDEINYTLAAIIIIATVSLADKLDAEDILDNEYRDSIEKLRLTMTQFIDHFEWQNRIWQYVSSIDCNNELTLLVVSTIASVNDFASQLMITDDGQLERFASVIRQLPNFQSNNWHLRFQVATANYTTTNAIDLLSLWIDEQRNVVGDRLYNFR